MNNSEFKKALEERTMRFAVSVFKFLGELPQVASTRTIAFQLGKSASSIGVNYREANRSESKDDFAYKISISLKECSESAYWLDIVAGLYPENSSVSALRSECDELLRIFQTISRTVRTGVRSSHSNTPTLEHSNTFPHSNTSPVSTTRTLKHSNTGFTLIELLIVVVVIVTLLGIVVRLAGMGDDSQKRSKTIARLQKLENCVSGYYAAFGCYPPVPLHGVRDIYRKVDASTGMQYSKERDESSLRWAYVRAACRSQPVAVEFPYNYKAVQQNAMFSRGSFSGVSPIKSRGEVGDRKLQTKSDWMDVQVFKFGLMSFLLPRYLFMLDGGFSELYDKQWLANNRLADIYDLATGVPKYTGSSWCDNLMTDLECGEYWKQSKSSRNSKLSEVQMNPSQMVCARWMQNLENTVYGANGFTFYGVDIDSDEVADYNASRQQGINSVDSENGDVNEIAAVHTPSDAGSGGGQKYLLDGMTVVDGWAHDFYYYSPPPYQSYRLWSAGPNGRTFPPWIDMEKFKAKKREHAEKAIAWTKDDIVHMSN